jgi:hypothetical protein
MGEISTGIDAQCWRVSTRLQRATARHTPKTHARALAAQNEHAPNAAARADSASFSAAARQTCARLVVTRCHGAQASNSLARQPEREITRMLLRMRSTDCTHSVNARERPVSHGQLCEASTDAHDVFMLWAHRRLRRPPRRSRPPLRAHWRARGACYTARHM